MDHPDSENKYFAYLSLTFSTVPRAHEISNLIWVLDFLYFTMKYPIQSSSVDF